MLKPGEAHKLLYYWRQSRADAELMEWSYINIDQEELIESSNLVSGIVPQAVSVRLFDRMNQLKSATNSLADLIPVVIAPVVARQRYYHGLQDTQSIKVLTPLWVPAYLDLDGKLHPSTEEPLPWLCRSLLEPSRENFTLGQLVLMDNYLTQQPLTLTTNDAWESLYQYAINLLEAASAGQWREALTQAQYEVLNVAVIKLDDGVRKTSHHVLKVYDHLLTQDNLPTLFSYYAQLQDRPKQTTFGPIACMEHSKQHVAHLNKHYPLSPSQREAISHILDLPEGELLAINGPPGTGKTTLLHDIVASMWVHAAINSERPPVIVVSSTNNQAVTNVLDSLQQAGNIQRWLPRPISSLGLYLVNDRKKQAHATTKGYHWLGKAGQQILGLPSQIETAEFLQNAKTYFLEHCVQELSAPITSVQDAISLLRNRIRANYTLLATGIEINKQLWEICKQHREKYEAFGGIAKYKKQLEKRLSELRINLEAATAIQRMWQVHCQQRPWWWQWLKFLPFVHNKIKRQNFNFLSAHNLLKSEQLIDASIQQAMQMAVEHANNEHQQQEIQLLTVNNDEDEWLIAQKRWFKWLNEADAEEVIWNNLFTDETADKKIEHTNILNWLDTHLRQQMFVDAMHYWEGRWLLAADQLDFDKTEKQNPQARKLTWQRYAMLTPCFVTTLFTGPGFFDCWQEGGAKPHYGAIDLLIIDEAGQVAPDVAGAMLALAKKALAVGDIKQIEPVWSVSKAVDQANALTYGLISNNQEFAALNSKSILVSSGSVMGIAQRVSRYQKPKQDGRSYQPGLFLAEHRRCLPEIISYCNQLAYSGLLKPRRVAEKIYPWPPMAITHVTGKAKITAASRSNEAEAQAIVDWLLANKQIIQECAAVAYPGLTLSDLVGIVTPFAQQRQLLERLLKKADLSISKVGTVHALQGAERSLIIFSPVYTEDDMGTYFFDRTKNMLNVAVSRARDCFLVLGDSRIFKANLPQLPSGLLARWLQPVAVSQHVIYDKI